MAVCVGQSKSRHGEGVPESLAALRQAVSRSLAAPAALVEEAAAAAEAVGLVEAGAWQPSSSAWRSAWSAICKVSTKPFPPLSRIFPFCAETLLLRGRHKGFRAKKMGLIRGDCVGWYECAGVG